jgi:hypothetical protein
MRLSDEQVDRFSRQILVPEIGGRGQERLLRASILCVGDTAELNTAAQYLAAAGVTVRRRSSLSTDITVKFDLVITSEPDGELRSRGAGINPLVMCAESTAETVWYSRRTRESDCRDCIRERGRAAARTLLAGPPLGATLAGGAGLALDAMKELLGIPGSRDIVAFGRGGLRRCTVALNLAGCVHGARSAPPTS